MHYREAEQIKFLYEALNQAPRFDAKRLYQSGIREFSRLEPRRSNPINRYQLPTCVYILIILFLRYDRP